MVEWKVDGDPDPAKAALGEGKSKSIAGGLSFSPFDSGTASISGGGSFGDRKELLGIYDVNSDGLPDQIYRGGNDLPIVLYNHAHPGADPSQPLFSRDGPDLDGLTGLGSETQWSWNVGAQVGSPAGPGASASYSNLRTSAEKFFGDLDGDGYIDLINAAGPSLQSFPCGPRICFEEVDYRATGTIDPSQDTVLQGMSQDIGDRTILGDPVLRWVAPYDGTIELSGTVQKMRPGGLDGVTVELYRDQAQVAEVGIGPQDTAIASFPQPTTLTVAKGESFYVRVKTGADEGIDKDGVLRDLVAANLHAVYLNNNGGRDPTGRQVAVFDSSDDMRLAGSPPFVVAPTRGEMHFAAHVGGTTGADLRVCVQRFDPTTNPSASIDIGCEELHPHVVNVAGTVDIRHYQAATGALVEGDFHVEPGQVVVFRVESDLSFDPAAITIDPIGDAPLVAYTEVCVPNESGDFDCSTEPARLEEVELSTTYFGPYFPLLPDSSTLATPYVAKLNSLVSVSLANVTQGPYLYTIRSDRQGIVFQTSCSFATCGPVSDALVSVTAGESLTADYVSDQAGDPVARLWDVHAFYCSAELIRGRVPRLEHHVLERGNRLRPDLSDRRLPADRDPIGRAARRARAVGRQAATVARRHGTHGKPFRMAGSELGRIRAERRHARRRTRRISENARPAGGGGIFAGNYARLSSSSSVSFSVDTGGFFGASPSVSASWTKTTADVMDMNGDGLADVVSGSGTFLGAIAGDGVEAPGLKLRELRSRSGYDYGINFEGGVFHNTTAGGRTINMLLIAAQEGITSRADEHHRILRVRRASRRTSRSRSSSYRHCERRRPPACAPSLDSLGR